MPKNNLLYIFADQWRYHAAGPAEEDDLRTPHMDAFARDGVRCTNAISTYPLCSPHRAALLTGKTPLACGMWTNCKTGLDISPCLAPQETLISDGLKAAGWRTAYIGKWHLDASERNFTSQTDCEEWDAPTPPGERRHHFDFWHAYGAMDNHLSPHYWTTEGKRIDINRWSPEHETDVLLDYLTQTADDRPFCAFVSWNPPHPPYGLVPEELVRQQPEASAFRPNVPEALRGDESFRKKFRQYFAAVEGLDVQFGRIVEHLKAAGLWENTLVVLSADHGDCMGSHGLYGKNIWYEESIRIPLYFGGGALESVQKGGACDSLIESCDHMPTLLDLLGVPVPPTVTGKSAARAVGGKNQSEKDAAFLCMLPGMPDLVAAFKKEGLDSKCFGWRGVRTKTHTYVIDNGTVPHTKQKRLLYDLKKDPYQLSPAELLPEDSRCADYDKLLRTWCAENKDFFLFDRSNA